MSTKNLARSIALAAVGAAVGAALLLPATASASAWSTLRQELNAGNRVEQAAVRRGYAKYTPIGLCDKQGHRFWCSVSGSRGDCYLNGQAWVSSPSTGYRVRFTSLDTECF